jgi:hypothetical protein
VTRNLYRISLGLYWAAVLVAVVGVTVYADTVQIETRTDLYFTIEQDGTLVAIYSEPGFDDYIPAGSTVTVSTRRTIVAASVAIGAVPTLAPRRRKR